MSTEKLIASLFILCIFSAHAWKDWWIEKWIIQQQSYQLKGEPMPPNYVPSFLPAETKPNTHQLVPRTIWQTWSNNIAAGQSHWQAMRSFIEDNPTYNYHLITDESAQAFMCMFYPGFAKLFQRIIPGAIKADIIRLALIYRYGGVYVDTDCHSLLPLDSIVWPNASVVTGLGVVNDFHQWLLIYSPRHPIMKAALKEALNGLLSVYQNRTGENMVKITGPGAVHRATREVLNKHQCPLQQMLLDSKRDYKFLPFKADYYCDQPVGVMQIYTHDILGGNIVFKDSVADYEKNKKSILYGDAQRHFETLFDNSNNKPACS